MLACLCVPVRPGNTTTAAPFFEGTYQPFSFRPSLVVNETFSWATPSLAGGTFGREAVFGASRLPERQRAKGKESETRTQREETRVVVAGRTHLERVVGGLAGPDR